MNPMSRVVMIVLIFAVSCSRHLARIFGEDCAFLGILFLVVQVSVVSQSVGYMHFSPGDFSWFKLSSLAFMRLMKSHECSSISYI